MPSSTAICCKIVLTLLLIAFHCAFMLCKGRWWKFSAFQFKQSKAAIQISHWSWNYLPITWLSRFNSFAPHSLESSLKKLSWQCKACLIGKFFYNIYLANHNTLFGCTVLQILRFLGLDDPNWVGQQKFVWLVANIQVLPVAPSLKHELVWVCAYISCWETRIWWHTAISICWMTSSTFKNVSLETLETFGAVGPSGSKFENFQKTCKNQLPKRMVSSGWVFPAPGFSKNWWKLCFWLSPGKIWVLSCWIKFQVFECFVAGTGTQTHCINDSE